jgi:hypothetical protein
MDKMLKKICLANGISLEDDEAARKAMDILTGNDGESAVHDEEVEYFFICGMCEGSISQTTKVNVWGHMICPHCKTPNIPNKT